METERVSDITVNDPVFGFVIPGVFSATALTRTLTRRNDRRHAHQENAEPYQSFAERELFLIWMGDLLRRWS